MDLCHHELLRRMEKYTRAEGVEWLEVLTIHEFHDLIEQIQSA